MNCRFCKSSNLHSFCDLGSTPLSNAFLSKKELEKKEHVYPLHAFLCADCLLVQLPTFHNSSEIFSDHYPYFSSFSITWLEHAKNFALMAKKRFGLNHNSLVIEIASNDGYLLQYFKSLGVQVLGIEPAKNVAQVAREKEIPTLTCFFGTQTARKIDRQADLLIGINVLAHVPDLNDFVVAMKRILKRDGTLTIEFPHLLKLIRETQFDTIYHEHFSYFSLLSVKRIFTYHGLSIFDVDSLPTHGGSLRIYAKHLEDQSKEERASVKKMIEEEERFGLSQLDTYRHFSQKVEKVESELLAFFHRAKKERKKVLGYGAPAKGNTLLNCCKINSDDLPFTVDINPHKQNKYLPGTHIPIYAPEKIFEIKPDYLLILPWNLKEEIISQMDAIRQWGGKFVTPLPQLQIY
ncbi:MAG: hypothetical protein KR126chlam2_00779 [Chlamydiae bacterium]|nr:hypothetical protein [Chlamydiota bacterium]